MLDLTGGTIQDGLGGTESYFDDGNGALFDNANVAALSVDCEAGWANGTDASAACMPVLTEGPALEAIRRGLMAWAESADRAA